jgi:hypothetical protein
MRSGLNDCQSAAPTVTVVAPPIVGNLHPTFTQRFTG